MQVLVVSTSVVPLGSKRYGGIEGLAYDFVEGLLELGHQVTVAAPQGSLVPEKAELIETVNPKTEQDRDDLALNAIIDYTNRNGYNFDVVHDFSHKHAFAGYPHPQAGVFMMWDPIIYKYTKAKHNIICLSNW